MKLESETTNFAGIKSCSGLETRHIRFALLEERPSVRSLNILPSLAKRFAITYITSGDHVPVAEYADLIKVRPPKIILQRSVEMSRIADHLYRTGRIDFAVSWERVGFLIRNVPTLLWMGASYIHEIRTILSSYPWALRWRAFTGFVHYGIPEIIACKRARRIIITSEAVRERLLAYQLCRPEQVSIVAEGVGQEFFDSYNEAKFQSPAIAFVGRLHPGKGIVPMAEEFVRRNIDATLYVAGTGPLQSALSKIASHSHRVALLGHLDKAGVLRLLGNTSIFVWPSYYEGCPLALLEAMASGHACVSYPEPASAELLGASGIYASFGDARALCDRLEELLANSLWTCQRARLARARARRFHWDRCTERAGQELTAFYDSLSATR